MIDTVNFNCITFYTIKIKKMVMVSAGFEPASVKTHENLSLTP